MVEDLLVDIFLVPGFMLDKHLWSDLRSGLSKIGCVFDVDTTLDTSIDAIAERAVSTMREQAIVIGFSMGGYIARAMAYLAPEKVAALALIATSSKGDISSRTIRKVEAGEAATFRCLSRRVIAASVHPEHRTDTLIDRVQRMSDLLGRDVLSRQLQIERFDDTHRLGEIRCPTAVIAARQDAVRSLVESEILYKGICGASLKIIEHCGHLIPLEQPDALLHALSSLCDRV